MQKKNFASVRSRYCCAICCGIASRADTSSDRSGTMQIWRMRPDGSGQEQVTSDEYNNWFPHISPDGQHMVFLTYDKEVSGHPENKDVMLRLINVENKDVSVLAKLFGGQGTINVPSWSPDSQRLAFVSYQLIP